jgi:hypothetical protein
MSAEDLIDKPVQGGVGRQVGAIDAIVTDKTAASHGYAVIGFGGKFGFGERQVLLRLDQLKVSADGSIRVPASDETALAEYPEYVEQNYTDYKGEMARLL